MTNPQNLRAIGDRIELLLDELRAGADSRSYDRAEELLRLITELYGGGLTRIVELARAGTPDLLAAMTDDDLVASLLVVHGLHPDDVATRVAAALDSVRPLLGAHGGDVELLGIDEAAGSVHLRLLGSCDGCPSSAVTLQQAVEVAILEAAPEIAVIAVEGLAAPSVGSVPVAMSTRKPTTVFDPATGCGATVSTNGSSVGVG